MSRLSWLTMCRDLRFQKNGAIIPNDEKGLPLKRDNVKSNNSIAENSSTIASTGFLLPIGLSFGPKNFQYSNLGTKMASNSVKNSSV